MGGLKGVILAGGYGTRLLPMTRVTNKHLLPVYDRPMVQYPIECLADAGIREILLVTGGNSAGAFVELLGNGSEFGLSELAYAYQDGAGGIAAALALAEDFAEGGPIVVALGDNIIQGTIHAPMKAFGAQLADHGGRGARIILSAVQDPRRFGVARFDDQHRLAEIIEKPTVAPSNQAVIGIYFYDLEVFDVIRRLRPSARGELEITDVNNAYLRRRLLESSTLEGWWSDAGTIESLYRATCLVAEHGANGRPAARAAATGSTSASVSATSAAPVSGQGAGARRISAPVTSSPRRT